MKLKFTSSGGESLGLAVHLCSEGHSVMFNVEGSTIGSGLVDNVSGGSEVDIYIVDDHTHSKHADRLREEGKRVLGTSFWAAALERNPEYASELIGAVGWDGDESIEKGTNLYITTWFNGHRSIATYASIVYRRFRPGGMGPDLGCSGVIANFFQPTKHLHSKILAPLLPFLRKANHKGCFHIHVLTNGERFKVVDISADLASPLTYLLFENTKSSVSDVLLRLTDVNARNILPLEEWGVGIMVSYPPYPYHPLGAPCELTDIHPQAMKHLWFVDMMRDEARWMVTGKSGKVGYITARGATPTEATKRVYRTIKNLSHNEIQYRDDIGKGAGQLLDKLRVGKWIR